MKTRFLYIILLLALIFSPVISFASSPAGNDMHRFFTHDKISCLDCHSYLKDNPDHPSVEDASVSCLECHEVSSGFLTVNDNNKVKCLACHSRHHEKISNDAHINVPCRACHQDGIKPVRESENNLPRWRLQPEMDSGYDPHRFIVEKEAICSRCHFKGNNLGVSDRVLPAKGIVCMPCHAATFSTGDILSTVAVIIFLIGIASTVFVWMAAGRGHKKTAGVKSKGFIRVFNVLIFNVIFQTRLLRMSVKRWVMHELIFFPFLIRFIWGITALAASLLFPEWNITWIMLDKNNPVTGLVFDITGLMILTGGLMIVFEKRRNRKLSGMKNLPKSSSPVNVMLGGMIITGFIVEGARIAMTGSPEGSQFAFVGFLISRILTGYSINGVYAYLWYLHAFLTAAFIACLPFSRMFHIFTAPLSLFIRGEYRE